MKTFWLHMLLLAASVRAATDCEKDFLMAMHDSRIVWDIVGNTGKYVNQFGNFRRCTDQKDKYQYVLQIEV